MDEDYELNKLMDGAKPLPQGRKVTHCQNGTTIISPYVSANTDAPEQLATLDQRVDSLFGAKPSYQALKKERPEHRLMLWLKLNGHKNKEIAAQTGYSDVQVRTVCKQPWFLDAFCRLSTESGRDSVQSFLEGEVLPAIARTVELSINGETDAVKLAANREILDRFLGKSVAKVESTNKSTVDVTIKSVEALQEEQRVLDQRLAANGLLPSTSSGRN